MLLACNPILLCALDMLWERACVCYQLATKMGSAKNKREVLHYLNRLMSNCRQLAVESLRSPPLMVPIVDEHRLLLEHELDELYEDGHELLMCMPDGLDARRTHLIKVAVSAGNRARLAFHQ